jgi:hypothetical protein
VFEQRFAAGQNAKEKRRKKPERDIASVNESSPSLSLQGEQRIIGRSAVMIR